jgi:short-subunit dehydrogenase
MEIFRKQNAGHLVVVSSIGAVRGMRRNLTTYAATKAGVASIAEGLRTEMLGKPITVTTLFPGYIRSEMNERVKRAPFMVDTETGCRAMVKAIEKERAKAFVPFWPWAPISFAVRRMPLSWVRKIF